MSRNIALRDSFKCRTRITNTTDIGFVIIVRSVNNRNSVPAIILLIIFERIIKSPSRINIRSKNEFLLFSFFFLRVFQITEDNAPRCTNDEKTYVAASRFRWSRYHSIIINSPDRSKTKQTAYCC